MRHSYKGHRAAAFRNLELTRVEMGHSDCDTTKYKYAPAGRRKVGTPKFPQVRRSLTYASRKHMKTTEYIKVRFPVCFLWTKLRRATEYQTAPPFPRPHRRASSRYSPRSFVIVATRSWAYTLRVANLRRQMPRNFRSSSMNSRFADDDATSATSFGDTKPLGRSSVLPLPEVTFEAHAFGNL